MVWDFQTIPADQSLPQHAPTLNHVLPHMTQDCEAFSPWTPCKVTRVAIHRLARESGNVSGAWSRSAALWSRFLTPYHEMFSTYLSATCPAGCKSPNPAVPSELATTTWTSQINTPFTTGIALGGTKGNGAHRASGDNTFGAQSYASCETEQNEDDMNQRCRGHIGPVYWLNRHASGTDWQATNCCPKQFLIRIWWSKGECWQSPNDMLSFKTPFQLALGYLPGFRQGSYIPVHTGTHKGAAKSSRPGPQLHISSTERTCLCKR